MSGPELVEGYLMQSGLDYDVIGEGMWLVRDDIEHVDNVIVTWTPPIILFRVKLMECPDDASARAALCERLLVLNTEMVAGAYGLEGDAIIATETLQSENLDFNEFQAGIEGLTLAIAEHYNDLKSFHHTND